MNTFLQGAVLVIICSNIEGFQEKSSFRLYNKQNLPFKGSQGFAFHSMNTTFTKNAVSRLNVEKSSEIQLSNFSELALLDNSSLTLAKNSVIQLTNASTMYVHEGSVVAALKGASIRGKESSLTVGSADGMSSLLLLAGSTLTMDEAKVDSRSYSKLSLLPESELNVLANTSLSVSGLNLVVGQKTVFTFVNSSAVVHNGTVKIGARCNVRMENDLTVAEYSSMKLEDGTKFDGQHGATFSMYNRSSVTFSKGSEVKLNAGSSFMIRSSTLFALKENLKLEIGHNGSMKVLNAHCCILDTFLVKDNENVGLVATSEMKNQVKCFNNAEELFRYSKTIRRS